MSHCDHLLSGFCPATPLNDFPSETSWPTFFKLHVSPSVSGEGPSTKLAAITICGENT